MNGLKYFWLIGDLEKQVFVSYFIVPLRCPLRGIFFLLFSPKLQQDYLEAFYVILIPGCIFYFLLLSAQSTVPNETTSGLITVVSLLQMHVNLLYDILFSFKSPEVHTFSAAFIIHGLLDQCHS